MISDRSDMSQYRPVSSWNTLSNESGMDIMMMVPEHSRTHYKLQIIYCQHNEAFHF